MRIETWQNERVRNRLRALEVNHSRLTSLVYPDGFTVSYNYASGLDDSISRLTSMSNSTTTLESYSYLGLGTVVARTHPESGVDLTYIGTGTGEAGDKYVGLDRFGRVIDQRWVNGSGTDKDRFDYGYDEDSNRLYRTNELNHSFDELYHANGASIGYDGLNQLSDFRRGTLSDSNSDMIPDTVSTASRTQNWDPDALGNFETVTTDGTGTSRTHNKQNQVTAVGANSLTFDNNGNMTTDETGRTIIYDAWNRLVKINSTTRYANDALGRRIKEGSNDLYYSTSWQVLEEYGGANPTARYVWSPVYVDALVLRNYAVTKNGGLTERLYVAQDANWNVTALIDTTGAVVERYVYDPYGRFDVKDASWGTRSSSSYAWVYLHQGGRWDATAALYNFRYRDYSPALMRWVSVDPIGFKAKDAAFYRYEGNEPISRLDPKGLLVTSLQACGQSPAAAKICFETGVIDAATLAIILARFNDVHQQLDLPGQQVAEQLSKKCKVIHDDLPRKIDIRLDDPPPDGRSCEQIYIETGIPPCSDLPQWPKVSNDPRRACAQCSPHWTDDSGQKRDCPLLNGRPTTGWPEFGPIGQMHYRCGTRSNPGMSVICGKCCKESTPGKGEITTGCMCSP